MRIPGKVALVGLSATVALSCDLVAPMVATADVGAWLESVGIAEAEAAPLDIETCGLAAVGALVVGTAVYLGTQTDAGTYVVNWGKQVAQDAWNWAKQHPDLAVRLADVGLTGTAHIAIDDALGTALEQWYSAEMQKVGIGGGQSVYADGLVQGTGVSSGTITVSSQVPYVEAAQRVFNVAKAGGSVAYVVQTVWDSGGGYKQVETWGSDKPFTVGWDPSDSSSLLIQAAAGSAIWYYHALYGPDGVFVGDGGGVFNRGASMSWWARGQSTVVLYPYGSWQSVFHPGIPYPDALKPGQSVYVPPIPVTKDGKLALPMPVPVANGHVGLTADGNTAVDTATGDRVSVADVAKEATQVSILDRVGEIADTIGRFFDFSRPIDWTPLQNVPVSQKFPFSIPWDLANAIQALVSPGQLPDLQLSFPVPAALGGGSIPMTLHWPPWMSLVGTVSRDGLLIVFNVGLLYGFRRLMGADV